MDVLRGSGTISAAIMVGVVGCNTSHSTSIGDPTLLGGAEDFCQDAFVLERTMGVPPPIGEELAKLGLANIGVYITHCYTSVA